MTDEDRTKKIEVQIADTGIGIRPELIPTMFEKFRQGDGSATREYGGTGIGLTIVKSFIQMLGGTVDVKSVVAKGSQFTITIPHLEVEKTESEEKPEVALINKENILVVLIEADAHIARLFKTYLVQDGYNVLALSSGKEALDEITRLNPNIICLNPILPDINGWELLKKIKSHESSLHIPTIIVTVVDNRARGKKLGAADYLIMPVQRNVFLKAIQKNLSRT
ncbi:ATP-binding protein [candidate division CSSED10-310 bacterium]|uniref:histidine kinase n=1 Tax=candidate division CSSED10-310 bacterium TaxID=2855610 RepID=A0ABV6Z1B7_UNCC1